MTLSKAKQAEKAKEKRIKEKMKAQIEGFATADPGGYIERVLRDSHTQVARDARTIEVLRVEAVEGLGTSEGLLTEENPYRTVVYWYTTDGRLIARRDSWEERDSGNFVEVKP